MSDQQRVLMGEGERRRTRVTQRGPPSAVRDLVPVLVSGGLILSLTGWVDVLGLYWRPRFGDSDWEFGIIARTFDVLPLPTVGLVLLALALRAMPERWVLARVAAIMCGLVALAVLGLALIFALDIPIAFRAVEQGAERAAASGEQGGPMVHAALKRIVAKAGVFAAGYVVAYAAFAILLWRGSPRWPVPHSAAPTA